MSAPSRIEQTVATWERWAQEAFIERAGILLDSGVAAEQADQMAFLAVGKLRRARMAGAQRNGLGIPGRVGKGLAEPVAAAHPVATRGGAA